MDYHTVPRDYTRGRHGNQTTSKSDIELLQKHVIGLQEQVSLLQNSRNNCCKLCRNKVNPFEEQVSCDVSKSDTVICLDGGNEKDCRKDESMSEPSKLSYVAELCSSVSLPGIKYTAQSEVPSPHRWLWGLLHTVALLISVSYIQNAYNHWQSSPILLSINNSLTRADEMPFPTVTVCEPLTIDAFDLDGVLDRCLDGTSWLCSREELVKLELTRIALRFSTSQIESASFSEKELPIFHPNTTFSAVEYFRFSSGIKLDIKHSLQFHYPGTYGQNPEEQYLSFRGFAWCWTFNHIKNGPRYLENTLKHELNIVKENSVQNQAKVASDCNWTPENMLSRDCRTNSGIIYTKRSASATITFSNKSEVRSEDLEVFIGNPGEYPHAFPSGRGTVSKQLPGGKIVKILLEPKLITAGSDLSDIRILNRGCAFSNEIELSLFKYYTRHNCIFECQVKCALSRCGCIPFDMPVFNSSIRLCGFLKHVECQKATNGLDYDTCGCECPHDCVSLTHDIVTEVSDPTPNDFEDLVVKYKQMSYSSKFRYSSTNSFEFVAYSLGILGVFNGSSLMLVWELLYWLTLRLWSTIGHTGPTI